jgi:DNA-binding MarR family transcriptional regulator
MKYPWPAFVEMLEDEELTLGAWRVYMRLVRTNPTIFHEPRSIKMWRIAHDLKVEKRTVIEAVNLLLRRGYLIDCGRGVANIRRVQVAIIRSSTPDSTERPAA